MLPVPLFCIWWYETLFQSRKHITLGSSPKFLLSAIKNKMNKLNGCLTGRWDQITSLQVHSHGELIRWRSLCVRHLWFTMEHMHFKAACFPLHFTWKPENFSWYFASFLWDAWRKRSLFLYRKDPQLALYWCVNGFVRTRVIHVMHSYMILSQKMI